MARIKASAQALEYVQEVGCSNDCSKVIQMNSGLPMKCKDLTMFESALLRERALEDSQLFASGFVRIVDRSLLGVDGKLTKDGIDVGAIRTQANGMRGFSECKYNFEGVNIETFEKRFYVVNTGKHLEICPKDFIGKKLSNLVGDKLSDFDYEMFKDSDLSDILIAAVIDEYNNNFIAKFLLLSVYENEGRDMHGDDGIFAKAWYASKGQRFHTYKYDLSTLAATGTINAIVGGNVYRRELSEFGMDETLMLLDFVGWLNGLKSGRDFMFNVSFNAATKSVTVVSRFATERIDLRVVLNDGGIVDWGAKCTLADQLAPMELVENMLINDVPLMFRFQEINETNFVPLFKRYIKEFSRYLHRNGFSDISMSDIMIGIDPEIMLERDDAVCGRYLAGGVPVDFMDQIGLSASKFVPINALNNTGLFFMTIGENLLLFGDGSNMGGGMPGTGNIRIIEKCDGLYGLVFDNPVGSGVEQFGAFAANLCDSWFVKDNDLDNRTPYENTRNSLMCYCDSDCPPGTAIPYCDVSATVSTLVNYDETADETTISVEVAATSETADTIGYDIGYSLSDGTNDSGITMPEFIITLPGDQTESGLVLSVYGNVSALNEAGETICGCPVSYSQQIGGERGGYTPYETPPAVSEEKKVSNIVETEAPSQGKVSFEKVSSGKGGKTLAITEVDFVQSGLSITTPSDWPSISAEIEAILACTCNIDMSDGLTVTLSLQDEYTTLVITGLGATLDFLA